MKIYKPLATLIRFSAIAGITSVLALACADSTFSPEIEALQSHFMQRDVTAMLLPANDTRDNLVFLTADRRKQQLPTLPAPGTQGTETSFGTYGYGSICVSDS